MATVGAFNSTLKGFLDELIQCCPDAPGIAKVQLFAAAFDTIVAKTPRVPMDTFVESMSLHADMIASKDPKLFEVAKLPGGISLKEAWDTMSQTTRNAVWQYLQMLFLLATTASAVPPDMLVAIENVAATYADKIQSGQLDMSAVAGMLLGGGLGDIAGLLPQTK